jgi:hypothetical protein
MGKRKYILVNIQGMEDFDFDYPEVGNFGLRVGYHIEGITDELIVAEMHGKHHEIIKEGWKGEPRYYIPLSDIRKSERYDVTGTYLATKVSKIALQRELQRMKRISKEVGDLDKFILRLMNIVQFLNEKGFSVGGYVTMKDLKEYFFKDLPPPFTRKEFDRKFVMIYKRKAIPRMQVGYGAGATQTKRDVIEFEEYTGTPAVIGYVKIPKGATINSKNLYLPAGW